MKNERANDDSAESDPVDAELIAYLDGELEPEEARLVEDKLDADPKLRARAEALKRSYDLLDFLPKPEPSSTFATRTMDKLPVSASASGNSTRTKSVPVATASSMSSMALAELEPTRSLPAWVWPVGLILAVGFALGVGYLGTHAARSYFFTPSKDSGADSLPLADVHVIENLPLYSSVDDLDFLNQLASPEFFGDELSLPEGLPAPLAIEAEKPSGKQLDDLFKTFRELPAERQEKIRTLDQQINGLEPVKRDRTHRLLEAYAAWMQRLAEPDRKEILAAPTAAKRLEVIREIHRKQWVASLPAAQRQKLKDLSPTDKADLMAKWRAEEEKTRADWALIRLHSDALRTNKQPWPFTDELMRNQVVAFVLAAYHPDDPKRNRLSTTGPDGGDLARFNEALDRARKGEWAFLGKAVYDFSSSKKYEMLPEPAKGNAVVDFPDLSTWPGAVAHFAKKKNAAIKLESSIGKWPDFALGVSAEMSNTIKLPANVATHHLGPCRPDEFKDDVRKFLGELKKKTSEAEWSGLKALDGKWPEYPRELIKLARAHDLSMPGVMPPGPPSLWEKTYNPARPMRPGG